MPKKIQTTEKGSNEPRDDHPLRTQAIHLRKHGFTIIEIQKRLKGRIAKSTLSAWCKGVLLTRHAHSRLQKVKTDHLQRARSLARSAYQELALARMSNIQKKNRRLCKVLKDVDVSKIALAVLYLGEGAKNPRRSSLMFGNSNPGIIALFLRLLHRCYQIDPEKFRCTVQCRSGQDPRKLVMFWHRVTGIPRRQFYQSRIDARTKNQITKKLDYMGVCRIDYFSSEIFREIITIGAMLSEGP